MPSKEFQIILEKLRSRPKPQSPTVQGLRAESEVAAKMFPPPADIIIENVNSNEVRGEWVSVPGVDTNRVIMFLHGGCFIMGSPKLRRERVSRIARSSGARAFVIAYRLAPEHPFPTAIEDCFAGYRWMLNSGISAKQIVMCGESAGSGLAMATLSKIKDAGIPMPASCVLISPWVDLTNSASSMTTKASADPYLNKEILDWAAGQYLRDEDRRNPLASPIFGDMHGYPSMFIQVGSSEVLLDDSVRLAERAKASGVPVKLDVWEEMIHVWYALASILPEGQEAIDQMGKFVRRSYGG